MGRKSLYQFALLISLLILTSLACSVVSGGGPPAPIQGPVEPATCSTEGYEHLPQGDILVAEVEGQELAEFTFEDGILYVTSGSQQNSTPLPEGIHYMTFVLVDGETAIARADMEVNICNGEFYYRPINITPIPRQDA